MNEKNQKYRLRPGIYLTSVCGEYLLVAASRARRYCDYVCRINQTGAFYWEMLQQNKSEQEMVDAAVARYQITDRSRVEAGLKKFIQMLVDGRYLIPCMEENKEDAEL